MLSCYCFSACVCACVCVCVRVCTCVCTRASKHGGCTILYASCVFYCQASPSIQDVGMQTTSTVHFVVPRGGIRPNVRPRTNLQSLPLAHLPEPLSMQATPGDSPGILLACNASAVSLSGRMSVYRSNSLSCFTNHLLHLHLCLQRLHLTLRCSSECRSQ